MVGSHGRWKRSPRIYVLRTWIHILLEHHGLGIARGVLGVPYLQGVELLYGHRKEHIIKEDLRSIDLLNDGVCLLFPIILASGLSVPVLLFFSSLLYWPPFSLDPPCRSPSIDDSMVVTEKQSPQIGETGPPSRTELDAVRLEAALGHKQELVRNFGLWSVTSLGIVIAKSVWSIFFFPKLRD